MNKLKIVSLFVLSTVIAIGYSVDNIAQATVPGVNELVSVNNTGNGQGGDNNAGNQKFSADGNYVVFESNASNFVTGDTNGKNDIFVRNLDTGSTVRVSVSSSGVESNGQSSNWGAISRDGRYVAFASNATNLIDGQTLSNSVASRWQVYAHDTKTGVTSMVSKTGGGTIADTSYPAQTYVHSISSDGRFVLFGATFSNLGTTIPSGNRALYMADRKNQSFKVIDLPSGAAQTAGVTEAIMSCDAALVTFSTTVQLSSSDTDSVRDVYLVDLRNGHDFVEVTAAASGYSENPAISCNGDFITFRSSDNVFAPTLVSPTDTNTHIYLYDRVNEEYALVDQTTGGTVSNRPSYQSWPSNDGAVVFGSSATNLDPAYTSGSLRQIYLRSKSGVTELLSRDSSGVAGNNSSSAAASSIESSGKRAVYMSDATNLISSDTNNKTDIFISHTGL